jgi:hypothetical protein
MRIEHSVCIALVVSKRSQLTWTRVGSPIFTTLHRSGTSAASWGRAASFQRERRQEKRTAAFWAAVPFTM